MKRQRVRSGLAGDEAYRASSFRSISSNGTEQVGVLSERESSAECGGSEECKTHVVGNKDSDANRRADEEDDETVDRSPESPGHRFARVDSLSSDHCRRMGSGVFERKSRKEHTAEVVGSGDRKASVDNGSEEALETHRLGSVRSGVGRSGHEPRVVPKPESERVTLRVSADHRTA